MSGNIYTAKMILMELDQQTVDELMKNEIHTNAVTRAQRRQLEIMAEGKQKYGDMIRQMQRSAEIRAYQERKKLKAEVKTEIKEEP